MERACLITFPIVWWLENFYFILDKYGGLRIMVFDLLVVWRCLGYALFHDGAIAMLEGTFW
jgi:hypothetical protein